MPESGSPGPLTERQLQRALAGDREAMGHLVRKLAPVIQARVARTLLRRELDCGRAEVRQVVEDLIQEVFLALFEKDAKILRSWQRERGLSLENFVGLVTERQVLSILRRARRNPWTEEPTQLEDMLLLSRDKGPEAKAASRERCRLLLERFKERLSPLGWHLFELLFLREMPVREVEQETGLSPGAIYVWRNRLREQARHLLQAGRKGG